ncbi:MAG TPA: NHL repeat-containing protein [Rubricoccaceae bacterium]|nr:NHL repeat-containing protein [Rubricoccaceae bacterium]
MLSSLRCPTCSAPLDPPGPHARSLTCPYCGASVLLTGPAGQARDADAQHQQVIGEVLNLLRSGSTIQAIKVYRGGLGGGLREAKEAIERLQAGQPAGSIPASSTSASPRPSLAFAAVAVLAVVGGSIWAAQRATAPARDASQEATEAVERALAEANRALGAIPGAENARGDVFAAEVLRFGSEGTGAGRFEDARSVAVDGDGRVYVAEYSGGRVQVFDSLGRFQTQWMADTDMPLRDLAADRNGTVYVVQRGRIRRYEGATGRRLDDVPSRVNQFDAVRVALDGTLWATSGRANIVHLTTDGEILQTIDLHEAVGDRADPERVAVSGTGDVYALDNWTGEVYHFDASGRFVDRFGGEGEGEGSMDQPADLAIDGRGRVYVSDLGEGIKVFDASGHYIDRFGGGVIFGIALTDRDELYAAARNDHAVVKYRLPR